MVTSVIMCVNIITKLERLTLLSAIVPILVVAESLNIIAGSLAEPLFSVSYDTWQISRKLIFRWIFIK